MRSKISFFNKTLYLKNITRYWPIWAAYLFVWILILPVSLGSSISYGNFSGVDGLETLRYNIFNTSVTAGTVMSLIFAVLTAMAVFSYMNNARSVNFTHSLPVRREGLFLTNYLSGLSFMLLPNILVFLITLAVCGLGGLLSVSALLTWLAVTSMLSVFFFSFAVLCAMLTGHSLVLPVIYIIFNFLVVGVKTLVQYAFQLLVYGASGSMNAFTASRWFSPAYGIMTANTVEGVYTTENVFSSRLILSECSFTGWPMLLIYFAAGIVLAALALLIYRRRKSEAAGEVIAVKPLKPVFKYCLAFGFSITLGFLLTAFFTQNSYGVGLAMTTLVCMLIAGAIGYWAGEMLLRKSLRVFKKSLRGLLAYILVFAALLLCVEFDAFGFESRIPDEGDVEYCTVGVYAYGGYYAYDSIVSGSDGQQLTFRANPGSEDYALLTRLHGSLISNKNQIEREAHNYGYSQYGLYEYSYADYYPAEAARQYTVRLNYLMKDGSLVSRDYSMVVTRQQLNTEGTPSALLEQLINTESATAGAFELSGDNPAVVGANIYPINTPYDEYGEPAYSSFTLKAEDAERLYDAVLSDYLAGRFGANSLLLTEAYYDSALNISIELEYRYNYLYNDEVDTGISYLTIRPNVNCTDMIAVLRSIDALDENMLLTLTEFAQLQSSNN